MDIFKPIKDHLHHKSETNNDTQQMSWELTDTIIKAEDIVEDVYVDQFLEFKDKYEISGKFHCIRDMHDTCIYLDQNAFDKFVKFKEIYDVDKQLVNLSHLFVLTVLSDSFAQVSNKVVPQSVIIKQIKICMLDRETKVYVMRKIELDSTEELFEDLIKLQTFKDRFGLI